MTPYIPEHDPAFWHDVMHDLLAHYGCWRHPGRVVLEQRGGECDSAHLAKATGRVVEAARRLGLVIEGSTVQGYRLVDMRQALYVRPGDVLVWPPRGERERHVRREELDGQLSIAEVGA